MIAQEDWVQGPVIGTCYLCNVPFGLDDTDDMEPYQGSPFLFACKDETSCSDYKAAASLAADAIDPSDISKKDVPEQLVLFRDLPTLVQVSGTPNARTQASIRQFQDLATSPAFEYVIFDTAQVGRAGNCGVEALAVGLHFRKSKGTLAASTYTQQVSNNGITPHPTICCYESTELPHTCRATESTITWKAANWQLM